LIPGCIEIRPQLVVSLEERHRRWFNFDDVSRRIVHPNSREIRNIAVVECEMGVNLFVFR